MEIARGRNFQTARLKASIGRAYIGGRGKQRNEEGSDNAGARSEIEEKRKEYALEVIAQSAEKK